MSLHFNRRSFLRGMLNGAAVCVAFPVLNRFLDGEGTAFADGTKLPVRFGTYFWGLGLTDTPTGGTRWVPSKTGFGYEIMPELESLKAVKDKVSVFSGFRAIGDGRPNLVHWSGHASILSGVAPGQTGRFDGPSFDSVIADAIGTATRFKVLDIDASTSRQPVSYSTREGVTFATPETTPLAVYQRLFGAGFQDPNSDNWKPDPSIMLRQSVLSAIKDQRQGWVNARGTVIEVLTWVQLPAVYYALRRNADYSPTGPGGEKTHISFALRVDALPAFVMTPDASKEVASVESYKAIAPKETNRTAAGVLGALLVVDGIVPDRSGKLQAAGPNAVILPPSTSSTNKPQ